MADALRERVQSGQYASESEVIRDGLRALFAQEAAVEGWLRDEVAAAYDAAKAHPASTATADEIRQRLAARRADS
jgi:putative addiction module CopG family antidote